MALEDETSQDRLFAAIGILQAHYLAGDTALNAEKIFGQSYCQDSGIEHVIHILIDLLPVVEAADQARKDAA
ncbi:hypothetical protein [Citreimonas salinaria]|uniref:Uncharacterized protein n=1 Tax=Citreimonas salinaria TaxID=321339 RepID=A0A1H3HR32_9RHOB|nr:hypothetical protein [Citreimonas salinaria]SDY17986.1 hypothetical protein SAMN05444340_104116 [Citreimonas salinaria]